MPHFGSRSTKGDLFVEYNVILPLEISPETSQSKSLYLFTLTFPPLSGVHSVRPADTNDFFPPSL